MGITRDNQRKKLYTWERMAFPHSYGAKLTIEQCEALVKNVWGDYFGIAPPKVIGRGRMLGTAKYKPWRHQIILPVWARNNVIVLHEVAHAIVQYHVMDDVASHGAEYTRIFIELLVRYAGANKTELMKSARAAKLKVATWRITPKPRRRRKKNLFTI